MTFDASGATTAPISTGSGERRLGSGTTTQPGIRPTRLERIVVRIPGSSTGGDDVLPHSPLRGETVPPERVYPHLYDPSAEMHGTAIRLISDAILSAQAAAESFSEADLQGVSSSLGLVAASLAGAHSYTSFNESLGSVVSYIRRATLRADVTQIELSQLMLLAQALRTLTAHPMLDLDFAAGLVDDLAAAGWEGELREVGAFLRSLWGIQETTPTGVAKNTQVAGTPLA